jgi:hypothetical protein
MHKAASTREKMARYAVAFVAVVILCVVWHAFAGRIGVVLGIAVAGLAFAMQEVIGAVAGWFNIVSGRVFRVGDRIQMGGVRGDVIDITPLRTKVMEIGGSVEDASWVRGRQFTGRIVAISNKMTFTEPGIQPLGFVRLSLGGDHDPSRVRRRLGDRGANPRGRSKQGVGNTGRSGSHS